MNPRTSLGLLLIVGATASSLAAQEHSHTGGDRLGRVVFPVSCAPEAQRLYRETGDSIQRREAAAALRRASTVVPPPQRPTKKQRRQIHRFQHFSD